MAKPKNIQISLELFNSLLYVFDYIDIQNYAEDFQDVYRGVLEALQDKKKSIELRADYSRLVAANKSNSEDEQNEARIEYLKNKNNPY